MRELRRADRAAEKQVSAWKTSEAPPPPGDFVYRFVTKMSDAPVPCASCGAMMSPLGDGRTYGCNYCHTQVVIAVEGHQIAAGMRLDLHNPDTLLAQLANTLQAGFAESTRVQSNGRHVLSIEVSLEPDVFLAHREAQGVVTQHKRVVRGIALRATQVPIDRWVQMLTDALARHANTNARAAAVLARLSGKG